MNNKKQDTETIVILGGGLLQKNLVIAANKKGWRTVVIDKNPKALAGPLATVFINISTSQPGPIIEKLKTQPFEINYCGTVGTDMSSTIAAINKAFALEGLNREQALVTTHKGKCAIFCEPIKFPNPIMPGPTIKSLCVNG
ncbi:MAG: hypothetical protein ABUK01_11440 [Leptospirales bacterium]